MLKNLSKKACFVLAIFGAAVVGGASTAFVRASVPTSSGQINACYGTEDSLPDPDGRLRVIDTDAAQTCTANETALSWTQSTPVLHDANGQVLGDTVTYNSRIDKSTDYHVMRVFNRTLKRVIPIQYDNENAHFDFGEYTAAFFTTTDCTDQAYLGNDPTVGLKTVVFRLSADPTDIYATVSNDAEVSTVMIRSSLSRSNTGDLVCHPYDENTLVGDFYPLTPVSLPFTTPIASPLEF